MSLHPIRLALGVRFLREKKIVFFLARDSPSVSPQSRQLSAKAFRGENVRRGICVLELVTGGVQEGEVLEPVRCPRVGPRLPPRPWNSPPPLGQGRSLLPPKLELPTSHKKNPFLMIVLLLRISYCTQGIVYCLLECLVVYQLFLVGHGERHDGNDLVRFPDPHYF